MQTILIKSIAFFLIAIIFANTLLGKAYSQEISNQQIINRKVTKSFSQARVLDSAVISKWPTLGQPSLSPNGKFMSYTVFNEPAGQKTFYLKRVGKAWNRKFLNAQDCRFSKNDSFALFMKSKNELCIFDLVRKKEKIVPNISAFQILQDENGNEFLICSNGNQLYWLRMNGTIVRSYSQIVRFYLSENKSVMVLQQQFQKNMMLRALVFKNNSERIVWEGEPLVKELITSEDGDKLAFLDEYGRFHYLCGIKGKEIKSQNIDGQLSQGNRTFVVTSILKFDRNQKRIFVKLSKLREFDKDSLKNSRIRISRSNDLKPELLQKNVEEEPSYIAVINLNTKKTLRLAHENERISFLEKNQEKYAILSYEVGDVFQEYRWNERVTANCFILNTKSGERIQTPIKYYLSCSSDENFFIGYDYTRTQLYCYNIKTKHAINLTKHVNLVTSQQGLELSLLGWIETSSILLLYDQYDIWRFDLNDTLSAECLTKRLGWNNKITFGLSEKTNSTRIPDRDRYILSAFNHVTKENGFYSLSIHNLQFEKLGMSKAWFSSMRLDHYGLLPLKANGANTWIVRRESSNHAPNYYSTSDFKNYTAETNLFPQQGLNWCHSELINYESLDGQKLQGLLYKPKNFNPKGKYPVIMHYYEEKSDLLNVFIKPELSDGSINIPWFVSRGYLVFTPDIHYSIGNPGNDALNSVVGGYSMLARIKYIDSTRIGLAGHSFGAYETNYIITHTNQFAAAVSAAGISNLISFYLSVNLGNRFYSDFIENGQMRMGSSIWENRDGYVKNSPIFYADKVQTPLLMMHNKLDVPVPQTQSFEFFIALRRLQKEVWLLQYEDEQHSLRRPESKVDYTSKVEQFFDYYLKNKPNPEWMKPQASEATGF